MRSYDVSFKKKVIADIRRLGYQEAADKHGIPRGTACTWYTRHIANGNPIGVRRSTVTTADALKQKIAQQKSATEVLQAAADLSRQFEEAMLNIAKIL